MEEDIHCVRNVCPEVVLKLSSGCIIAEITSGVGAMAEEKQGAEVFVYAQNGSVLGGSCHFPEAYIIQPQIW